MLVPNSSPTLLQFFYRTSTSYLLPATCFLDFDHMQLYLRPLDRSPLSPTFFTKSTRIFLRHLPHIDISMHAAHPVATSPRDHQNHPSLEATPALERHSLGSPRHATSIRDGLRRDRCIFVSRKDDLSFKSPTRALTQVGSRFISVSNRIEPLHSCVSVSVQRQIYRSTRRGLVRNNGWLLGR